MMVFSLSYYTLAAIIFGVFGLLIYFFSRIEKHKQKNSRIQFEKNIMNEKEREISLQLMKFQHENTAIKEKNNELKKEKNENILKFENLQKEFFEKTQYLSHATHRFEQEEERVRRVQEEKIKHELNQYSTAWNLHEKEVIAKLKEYCISPLSSFTFFENTTLPPCFDGSIKPDFCITYANRYIVFDAKKSKNISQYIKDQVKNTAEKYKNIREISRQIFFIVPDQEFKNLSKTIHSLSGFTFIVLPLSHIESTLFLLSKMQSLEILSEINPEEREKIIHCIMQYIQHVSVHNSINILMAEKSFDLQKSVQHLPQEFSQSFSQYTSSQSPLPFSLQKAKSLAQNYTKQEEKIMQMKTPQIT